MLTPRSFLLALSLGAIPVQVQAQVSPTPAPLARPNANLEAQTARALSALAPAILNKSGNNADSSKLTLATTFAKLGRIDAGLRAANALKLQEYTTFLSAPYARDEVRRLGAKRRALAGDIAGARQLTAAIVEKRARADALFAIARAQTRAGDVSSAQKTLFQALPLVDKVPMAQMYAAVLLHRAAEPAAAKRLLDRVEKSLPPFAKRDEPGDMRSSFNWDTFTWALFQTGQADKGAQMGLFSSNFYVGEIVQALVRQGQFDAAEKVARQKTDIAGVQEREGSLLLIARGLWNTQPERAAALAQEVIERAQKLPVEPEFVSQGVSYPSQRDSTFLTIATFYQKVGEQEKAATLSKQVMDRLSPSAASWARLSFDLTPLMEEMYLSNGESSSIPPSREQVQRLAAEIEANVPKDTFQYLSVLLVLAEAQSKAGMTDAARQTLAKWEQKGLTVAARLPGTKASDPRQLGMALGIARNWQLLGDKQGTDSFLKRLWDSPLASAVPPRERAWKFITSGFWSEGRQRLMNLGIKPAEETSADFGKTPFAYFEAKAAPNTLPTWIQSVRDPQKKLMLLSEFTRGLTADFLDTKSEREFSLSAGGFSSSMVYR